MYVQHAYGRQGLSSTGMYRTDVRVRLTRATVLGMAMTLSEHLDRWLVMQRGRLQPSTVAQYEAALRLYVRPHLGGSVLASVRHHDVTKLYAQLLAGGGHRGKPLALGTVRRTAAIVHKVLADAVRLGLIDDNPCDSASLPRFHARQRRSELRVWTAEQLTAFLEAQRGRPLWALWEVAAGTGLRRGELLGLRWKDVDLRRRTLHVRRALTVVGSRPRLKVPKTNQARSLHVGARVIAALEHQRTQQARQTEQDPLVDAPTSASWGLFFTEPDGGHVAPMKVTDTWRERVRASDQPVIRFHDLRHTHATLLLQAGVPAKVVSGRLGHASIQTTLDIYAEVLPAMDAEAASAFESHVFDARGEPGREGTGT